MPRIPLTIDASIALLPIVGLGLVMLDQAGRYMFYDIPLQFLEVDAYKLITSTFSLVLVATSTAYFATAIVGDDPEPKTRLERTLFYAVLGIAITSPLWLSTLNPGGDIDWFMVCLALAAGFAAWLVRKAATMRSRKVPMRQKIEAWSLAAFAGAIGVFLLTITNGYMAENGRSQLMFIAKTQRAVVGRVGDLLIAKEIDPATGRVRQGRVVLLSVDKEVVLEPRSVRATR